jgi:hypothetical protein
LIKKLICFKCGAVNQIEMDKVDELPEDEDWLVCEQPERFEWKLPAGKITPVIGDPIYISGSGAQMSREEYIERYGLDPEIALRMMRSMNGAIKDPVKVSQELTKDRAWIPGSIKGILARFHRGGLENTL